MSKSAERIYFNLYKEWLHLTPYFGSLSVTIVTFILCSILLEFGLFPIQTALQ